MKKHLALLLAAVLLLCSGCAGGVPIPVLPSQSAAPQSSAALTEAPTASSAPASSVPTEAPAGSSAPAPTESSAPEPTEAQLPEPWELLEEELFEQGSFEMDGYSYTYSYDLPRLTADTAGARAINRDLSQTVGAEVREALDNIAVGNGSYLLHCGFHTELWGDLMTLIVTTHNDYGMDGYRVYCYDRRSGVWLDTPALLERMGIPREDFLEACRSAFVAFYEDMYSGIPADQRESYGYSDGLARVPTDRYVNLDLMAYPSPEVNGRLAVIAPIVSLAGADYYYHTVYLELGGES